MNASFDLFRSRPHDTYFEQVFKVQPVALQLLQQFLPPAQLATLKVCLLLEHKSGSTGRRIYVQLGNYLRGVQDEDISQQRSRFTLTIPILFYHGKTPWSPGPLREEYGIVPEALSNYIPHFDFLQINLQVMHDEEIRGMQDAMLLRNIFLVFKHAREEEFVRRHFSDVLIFVQENLPEEVLTGLFQATFLYLHLVSPLNKHDIMELVETLPSELEHNVQTIFEQFMEEGYEKGIEKGIEKLLITFLKKNPAWTDQAVADCFDIPVSTVKKVRLALNEQV
ncbi:MAG: Rpn family recombination-promoting nuclease/putative transposase [Lewinellaceae bacterium]|nr:Rpn family recombination-promoting nuclease/putative transposase [Lewinellaceae bacterium]